MQQHLGKPHTCSKHSKSKVMVVGTYRDQVSQGEFDQKDKLLQKKLKDTPFYDKGVIEFASEDQLMLAVDNMSGGQDEKFERFWRK